MASLTLAEAETILAAAKAKVQQMGAKMSISVVDPRGDLVTMFRGDGASWRPPPISRAKANSSACFGRISGELTENALAPEFRGLMAMEGGHMIPGQGALPVFKNGELVGGVGGSGTGSGAISSTDTRLSAPWMEGAIGVPNQSKGSSRTTAWTEIASPIASGHR